MSSEKPSQSINISGSNLSGVQIGQAGGNQSQFLQGSGSVPTSQEEAVILLARLENLLVAVNLPSAHKKEALRYLGDAKEEAQAEQPNKRFTADSLKRVAGVLKEADEACEAGQGIWGKSATNPEPAIALARSFCEVLCLKLQFSQPLRLSFMTINQFDPSEQNQDINISKSSIQDSQLNQAGRDSTLNNIANNGWMHCLIQGANSAVTNIFHVGFDAISRFVFPIFRSMVPETIQNDPSLVEMQNQCSLALIHLKQEELQLEQQRVQLEQLKLKYNINSTERIIQIQQEKNRLWKQEIFIKNIFQQQVKINKECHDETIRLKMREIQVHWDALNPLLIFERGEVHEFLFQKIGNLFILLAPPNVPDYIQEFQHLAGDIDHEIGTAIETYYSRDSIHYPIQFYTLFKKPIIPTEAIRITEELAPLSTLILSSEVTDREVRICVTYQAYPNLNNSDVGKNQIRLGAWDWEDVKSRLESQGSTYRNSLISIRKLIAFLHTVLAIYFSDLYCLRLEPYHNPKLFDFLKEPTFPEELQGWVKDYHDSLMRIQQKIQEEERKRVEELERRRQEQEEQERQRQQEELLRRTQVTLASRSSESHSDDWGYAPLIVGALSLIMLLNFCGRNLPITDTSSGGGGSQGWPAMIQVNNDAAKMTNLRSSPNGEVIGTLLHDTPVTVVERSNDGKWYYIKLNIINQGGFGLNLSGWARDKFSTVNSARIPLLEVSRY